ncbi:MAG: hypothetical protein ACE5ED_00720 [Rhodothalassiaceae bacterium]
MNDRVISDERLGAYLDGELPAHEAADIAAALARSPELAARLARLRDADRLAARALHAIDDRPLPPVVAAMLAPGAGTPVLRPRFWRAAARPLALAASIALLVGFGAGFLLHARFGTGAPASTIAAASLGEIDRDQPLFAVLETTPSGTRKLLAGLGIEATPTLSFRAKDGRYCREMLIAGRDLARRGLFCRGPGGVWRALAMVTAPAADETAYVPAADPATALLDRAISARIAGAPLDAAEERRLIEEGWPQPAA